MKYLAKIHIEFVKRARTYPDQHIDGLVTRFLRQYPNPSYREFEDWARRMYIDEFKARESAYRLATQSVR